MMTACDWSIARSLSDRRQRTSMNAPRTSHTDARTLWTVQYIRLDDSSTISRPVVTDAVNQLTRCRLQSVITATDSLSTEASSRRSQRPSKSRSKLKLFLLSDCFVEYSVSQKIPPEDLWQYFQNGLEFFNQILHAYYAFLHTLDYEFLFKYLQV